MNNDCPSSSEENKKRGGKWILTLVAALVILAVGVYGGTYLVKQKPTWFGLPLGTEQAQAEMEALIARVSKLMILPTNEVPTIATVTDISAVKDQMFFQNAQNGDKVLIYQSAGKAILYRESENKIIEVGAVNFNQTTETPEASETPLPSAEPATVPIASPSTPSTE